MLSGGSKSRSLISFIYIFFSLVFVIHVGFMGHKILYPEVPEMIVNIKNLGEIEFPILFQICAFDIDDNDERYNKVGYQHSYYFFLGKSMFNDSVYGWNGHQANGSTLDTVEGEILSQIRSCLSK